MAVLRQDRLSLAGATLLICLRLGFGEEICLNKVVDISCSDDESLFIESAIIGRLNGSRCYTRKDNEQECRNDIRRAVQKRSRENSLRIQSADEFYMPLSPHRCLNGSEYSLEIKHRCLKRERHEVCIAEEFKVECEESIEIQNAVFGRMRSTRCIDYDAQNLSCAQDVKMIVKSICDKRKNCSFVIYPGMFQNLSCDRSLEQYLEVSHTCLALTDKSGNYSSSNIWLRYMFVVLTVVSVALCVAVVRLSYKCKREATENVESRNHGEQREDYDEGSGDRRLSPFVVCPNDLYTEDDDQPRFHSHNQYSDCQINRDEDAYSECKFPLENNEQYSVLKNTEP